MFVYNLQQIVAQAALGGSGDVGLICTILDTLFCATPDSIICGTFVAFDRGCYVVLGG
jgi:hypothetical protein